MEEGDPDMILTTNIEADVARANLYNPIIIAEDDENSHVLVAQIMKDGDILKIPSSGFTVKLHYKRADGTKSSVTGSVSSNKIRVELPDALLQLDDMVVCDLVITRQVSKTIHSLSVNDGEIVVSTTSGTYDSPLRTALFYIDSQLRVITEYEGGEI